MLCVWPQYLPALLPLLACRVLRDAYAHSDSVAQAGNVRAKLTLTTCIRTICLGGSRAPLPKLTCGVKMMGDTCDRES